MSHAVALLPPLTTAAFAAFLDGQRDDMAWDFVDGRILALTDPTLDHAEIVGWEPVTPMGADDRLELHGLLFDMTLSPVYDGVALPSG